MINPFELKIREIFYLVGEYGIKNTPNYKVFSKSEEEKKEFLINCRKGFRLGQKVMVIEAVRILTEFKKKKVIEKKAKKQKDKKLLEELAEDIWQLEYDLALIRHFADFLAWLVFRNEWHKIRRFYSGERTRPSLLESNLQSVLASVEHFHSLDDLNFALITDLTSFIDIGDLIVMTADKVLFIECKSGQVQQHIFEFIEELLTDDFDPAKVDYTNKNNKFFDQLERTLRQQERNSHAVKFFNTEEGIDPFSKKEIKLTISTAKPVYYHEILEKVANESFEDDSAYNSVEDIIHIAAYRESKLGPSKFIFDTMLKNELENYIIIDYMQLVYAPLKEPLLFKSIGKETIFDLMFNRLYIFLALDLDKLIELFNKKGVKARWLTEKETNKYLSQGPPKPFVYNKRGIQISTNGHTLVLGTTFTVNLLLDNMTPSALVNRYAMLH